MKSLIRIAIIAVIGVLAYNYFYGSEEEKATSQRVIDEVKDVGVAIKDLVSNERQRIKEGKYDGVLSKLGSQLKDLGGKLDPNDQADQKTYEGLQQEQKELQTILDDLEKNPESEAAKGQYEKLAKDLDNLVQKIKDFSDKQDAE